MCEGVCVYNPYKCLSSSICVSIDCVCLRYKMHNVLVLPFGIPANGIVINLIDSVVYTIYSLHAPTRLHKNWRIYFLLLSSFSSVFSYEFSFCQEGVAVHVVACFFVLLSRTEEDKPNAPHHTLSHSFLYLMIVTSNLYFGVFGRRNNKTWTLFFAFATGITSASAF